MLNIPWTLLQGKCPKTRGARMPRRRLWTFSTSSISYSPGLSRVCCSTPHHGDMTWDSSASSTLRCHADTTQGRLLTLIVATLTRHRAGTDKSRILMATIYLVDMADYAGGHTGILYYADADGK